MTTVQGCPAAAAFDPFGTEHRDDPVGTQRVLPPAFYSSSLDCYVVTGHDEVRRIYRETDAFSSKRFAEPVKPLCSAAAAVLAAAGFQPAQSLATTDGPLHAARRRRLEPFFRAEALAKWEPRITEVYSQRLDEIIGRGRADLVADLFWEPPATIATEFMGVSERDADLLKRFAAGLLDFTFGRPTDDEQIAICTRMGQLYLYGQELVARLREDPSGSGLLPFAVRLAADEPELFDTGFLVSLVTNTLTAAHETTTGSLANGTIVLLSNRASWAAIGARAELVPGAVEECLRVASPLTTGRRLCVRDTEIAGVLIPAGSMVLLGLAGANHDESTFTHAGAFDIGRAGARRHLTFGSGPHYCLGAPLARLQMKVAFTELSSRLPDLELTPGQVIEHGASLAAWSPRQVLVRWTPERSGP